jgi:hypothetical protein
MPDFIEETRILVAKSEVFFTSTGHDCLINTLTP